MNMTKIRLRKIVYSKQEVIYFKNSMNSFIINNSTHEHHMFMIIIKTRVEFILQNITTKLLGTLEGKLCFKQLKLRFKQLKNVRCSTNDN